MMCKVAVTCFSAALMKQWRHVSSGGGGSPFHGATLHIRSVCVTRERACVCANKGNAPPPPSPLSTPPPPPSSSSLPLCPKLEIFAAILNFYYKFISFKYV